METLLPLPPKLLALTFSLPPSFLSVALNLISSFFAEI